MSKQKAIIVDIDGTIAKYHNRSVYDTSKCENDLPKQNIIDVINVLKKEGYAMIIITGRNKKYLSETCNWLAKHKVNWSHLFMRPETDPKTHDDIVKKTIYQTYVEPYYDVCMVFEDRDRVVDMWRELGLTCCQVDYGNF